MMLRNREFMCFMALSAAASAMLCTAMYSISRPAFYISLIAVAFLNAAYYAFTAYRYYQLKKLSEYLQSVYSGNRVLDIRQNTEGELSILKNDIYKITVALSEQTSLLKQEKGALAEALGDISHQLKTPLTGALITADLLEAENLTPEKSAEFVRRIRMLLEKLNWLCAALLSLSRLDAGAVRFARQRQEVSGLIIQAAQPLQIMAEINGVDLKLECGTKAEWVGDKHWTTQALLNIMKNCIEHTQSGGYVRVQCEDTPLHCQITISDNGGGIPSLDLPHIFERFYKGENSRDDSAGIGLALSKSVIEKQGGALQVHNTESGACFTVYLNKLVV